LVAAGKSAIPKSFENKFFIRSMMDKKHV